MPKASCPGHAYEQSRFDFLFGDDGRDNGSPGRIEYRYANLPADTLNTTLERLRANGWTADVRIANKGDVQLGVETYALYVQRAEPKAVTWLTIFGAVVGALGGWLLTARISRRLARTGPGIRIASIVLFGWSLLALTPFSFYCAFQLAHGYDRGAPWAALDWEPTRVALIASALCGVAALALCEIPAKRVLKPL